MMACGKKVDGIIDKTGATMEVLGVPVIGCDDDLEGLFSDGYRIAYVAVGGVFDSDTRTALYSRAKEIGFRLPAFVARTSMVQQDVEIDEGTVVLEGAIVNVGATLGRNTIVNSGAVLEHDVKVGSNTHVAPGAVVCGGAVLGDGVFVGAGATVVQGVTIGEGTTVGAGSVVVNDVPRGVVVVGNPARIIRPR